MTDLSAADVTDLFRTVSLRIGEARAALGALDGAIGDGDHGNSMAEGFAALTRALVTATREGKGAGELFPIAATSFLDAVGATTGPLYASAFLSAGQLFSGMDTIPAARIPELITAFHDGIARRGKASAGDKTMLDAWRPAARAQAAAGPDPLAALAAAEAAANEGRDATRAMVAALGRAARLGSRTLGHIDPGAASAVIIIAGLREGLTARLARGAG